MNANSMYTLSYGLFVLTAHHDEKDNGCIINTAIQAASEPNQICISVNKSGYTHDMLLQSGAFALSVLDQTATLELIQQFGYRSGRDADKFADYADCARTPNGLYYVTKGTNAVLSAKVDKTLDLGSHTLFVGEVTHTDMLSDKPSMTYAYYSENVKPKPTESPEKSGKTVWRCTVCGYEYEGEHLPEDFVCPWCKHPASDFVCEKR